MDAESGVIRGDLVVTSDVMLRGIVTGVVTVSDGGHCALHGIARGLVIEPGGSAVVRGIVDGDVTNLGGTLDVFGTVIGVVHKRAGRTYIADGAVIRGARERVEVTEGSFPDAQCLLCHQSPCVVRVRWWEHGVGVTARQGSSIRDAHLCQQHRDSADQVKEMLRKG